MSIEDFCSDNNISCETCKHYRNIMGSSAVPVYSCDTLFAGGAYSGSYVIPAKHNTFACIKWETVFEDDDE